MLACMHTWMRDSSIRSYVIVVVLVTSVLSEYACMYASSSSSTSYSDTVDMKHVMSNALSSEDDS